MLARLTTVFLTMLLCGIMNFSAHATSSLSSNQYDTLVTSTIQFRHGRSTIDSTYLDNTRSLAAIRTALKQAATEPGESIVSIIIEGHASPVGKESYNQRLSMRRAQKAEAFLRTVPGFETVHMILVGKGEDWHTFSEDIKSGYHRQNRTEVLAILDQNLSTYKKESQLKALDHGQATWNYLVENHMATSRHAVAIVVVKKRRSLELLPHPDTLTAKAVTMLQSGLAATDVRLVQAEEKKTILALKTNLLYDVLTLLNFSIEVPLYKDKLSLLYYHQFPWWTWGQAGNEYCARFLSIGTEARWWFKTTDRFNGHFLGAYAESGKYDFGFPRLDCYQGEFFSTGLTYGYAMPVGRYLHLEFSLSVGYASIPYRGYTPSNDYEILWKEHDKVGRLHYVGPTKAQMSLVIPIRVKKRGGNVL